VGNFKIVCTVVKNLERKEKFAGLGRSKGGSHKSILHPPQGSKISFLDENTREKLTNKNL
jgi:hypothetical protein